MVGVVGIDHVVEDEARDAAGPPAASAARRARPASRSGVRASKRLLARTTSTMPGAVCATSASTWAGEVEAGGLAGLRRDVADVEDRGLASRAGPRGSSGIRRLGRRLVNRLPGPDDDEVRLGDRRAARPPRPARPSGVSQRRWMPSTAMIEDWPSTTRPSASSGVERQRRPAMTGTTWPRTARIRLIRRTPSSKSPPSTAVIAARSRLPTACPPRPVASPSAVVGEAVLEQVAHERLGIGEGGDAVADVPDRRDAEARRGARRTTRRRRRPSRPRSGCWCAP